MFFTDNSDITALKEGVCESLLAWQITYKLSGGTVLFCCKGLTGHIA